MTARSFDFTAKRRREIVLLARHVGAADTEDLDRYLVAWVWHNTKAKDQVWAVMEAAKRMGGSITEAKASDITEEASVTRKHLSADNAARFLGVTYQQRQALGLTTIGSVNVKKLARKELRKRRDRMNKERRRRAQGAIPRAEYRGNSLSTTKPWEKAGMSRRTWYRNKQRTPNGTGPSTPICLSSEDTLVPLETQKRQPSEALPRREERGCACYAHGDTLAVDAYAAIAPLEKRANSLNAAQNAKRPRHARNSTCFRCRAGSSLVNQRAAGVDARAGGVSRQKFAARAALSLLGYPARLRAAVRPGWAGWWQRTTDPVAIAQH
jgi:hypothetical protein